MKTTQMLIFILLTFMVCTISCKKEENNTNVEDQEWYINLKTPCDEDTICKTEIIKAQFDNETVYYTKLGGALCDPVFHVTLLNNNGEVVKEYDLNDTTAFYNEVTYIETTYKCE